MAWWLHHPQDSRAHLIRTHTNMGLQVPLVAINLIFAFNGRGIIPPVPVFQTIHLRAVCTAVASEDWGKKNCWLPQPPPCLLFLACLYCSLGGFYVLLDSLFPVDVPIEAFLTPLCTTCWVQFHLGLGLPDPIPIKPSNITTLLPRYLSLLPLPAHVFLALQFDKQVPVQPCWSQFPFLTSYSCGWRSLVPEESSLNNLPPLLCSFVLQDTFLGVFAD